jgi:hypothetical protein
MLQDPQEDSFLVLPELEKLYHRQGQTQYLGKIHKCELPFANDYYTRSKFQITQKYITDDLVGLGPPTGDGVDEDTIRKFAG